MDTSSGSHPEDRLAPIGSSLNSFSRLAAQPASAEPPPARSLPPGLANHPNYTIVRELGRGGMGVVYLAENKLMGRKEVLKVASADLVNSQDVLDRFLREIRAAARLRHTNIVTAYSAFRAGESFVFAMEYVEGYDLAQLVRGRGALAVAHACSFVYQAALGLQYAHTKGMVHRDIKPSNLIVTREEKKAIVKVLDFGLAKITSAGQGHSSLTHAGQILGTPEYIAPEQIRNSQAADIRADIYSLGCTLYYLLAARPPFAADNVWALCHAHLSTDADPLHTVRAEVPPELAALVAKLMAKDPVNRFQTPGEAAQALAPFFRNGGPPFKGPETVASRSGLTNAGQQSHSASAIPGQPAVSSGKLVGPTEELAEPPGGKSPRASPAEVTETRISRVVQAFRLAVNPQRPPWIRVAAITALLLLGLCGLFWARMPFGAGGATEFVSLFNGKDLAGWQLPENATESWTVVDGVLKGTGTPAASSPVTERADFANFHLRVETRLAEGHNGGIFFRWTDVNGQRAVYDAVIGTTSPDSRTLATGCLRFSDRPGSAIILGRPDSVPAINPGEWFMEEVIANGDFITILVKGTEVIKFKDLHHRLSSGAIGLLCRNDSKVAFRKIEIRELSGVGSPGKPPDGSASDSSGATFNSSRTASVGPAGHWQIENDQIVQTTLERDGWIVFGDQGWTDYSFSADVKVIQSNAHVGLYFRSTAGRPAGRGGDNYFFTAGFAGQDGGSICRVVHGNFEPISGERNRDATLTPGKWHRMRIDAAGQTFTAYLDGDRVFSVSDAANSRGRVGLRAFESVCRFRNLTVTAPNGETLWRGLPELRTNDAIGVSLRKAKG